MNIASAHHRALPEINLFPKRRHWRFRLAATGLAVAALPGLILATAAPRSAPGSARAAGGTVVLLAVTRPAASQTAGAYRIRAGDTLSAIAARLCGSAADYAGLAAANGIADPDLIYAGRTLYRISCHASAGAVRHAITSGGRVWGVSYGFPNYCGDGDHDGWDVACTARQSYAAPARTGYAGTARRSYAAPARYSGSSGCQALIIAHESGGNSQVMNSSGHYGLYQFDAGTWAANGGSPADFGHASVAEQNRVYYNTVARSGYAPWAASGGC